MAKRKVLGAPGPVESSAERSSPAGTPQDPRWALHAHGDMRLLPAVAYQFMTGTDADVRLKGWVKAAQGAVDEARLWAVHGESLTAAARPYGFEPWRARRRRPHGPGFARWRRPA